MNPIPIADDDGDMEVARRSESRVLFIGKRILCLTRKKTWRDGVCKS